MAKRVQPDQETAYAQALAAARERPHSSAAPTVTEPARRRRSLAILVAVIMFCIIIAWVATLPLSLRRSARTAQTATPGSVEEQLNEWQNVRDQLNNSLANVRAQFHALEQSPTRQLVLSQEQAAAVEEKLVAEQTSGWVRFTDFDRGYSVAYPPDWSVANSEPTAAGGAVTITFQSPNAADRITLVSEPTPFVAPTTADGSTAFVLDGAAARRYRDGDSRVVAGVPNGAQTITLRGSGDVFELLLKAFHWVQ